MKPILIKILAILTLILLAIFILLYISARTPQQQTAVFSSTGGNSVLNQDGEQTEIGSDKVWIGTGGTPGRSYLGLRFVAPELAGKKIIFARLKVVPDEETWIGTSFAIYAELAQQSADYSKDNPASARVLTLAKTEYNADSKWLANTPYYFDVTAELQELFAKYQQSEGINLIARSTASTAFGRKYFPVKSIQLIVDYSPE
jgi:hypothetical protein